MTDANEIARLVGYMPIVVRTADVSEWERKFCASIIWQDRKGRTPTEKQIGVMRRIVRAFQDRELRDELIERE